MLSREDGTGGLVAGGCHHLRPRRIPEQLRQPQLRQGSEVVGQAPGEDGDAAASLTGDRAPILRHLEQPTSKKKRKRNEAKRNDNIIINVQQKKRDL